MLLGLSDLVSRQLPLSLVSFRLLYFSFPLLPPSLF